MDRCMTATEIILRRNLAIYDIPDHVIFGIVDDIETDGFIKHEHALLSIANLFGKEHIDDAFSDVERLLSDYKELRHRMDGLEE